MGDTGITKLTAIERPTMVGIFFYEKGGKTMEETLQKLVHDMGFACEGLQEALKKASSVEGLVILPLIGRASELRRDVEALLQAYQADHKG